MSPEQITQLVETAVGRAVSAVLSGLQGSGTAIGSTGRSGKRTLEPKGVSRVDTFIGKDGQWREWAFQFRVAVKAMEASTVEILNKVERDETAHVLSDLELEFGEVDVTRLASELYDVLCLCLKGDPLVLVQGVLSMNGFEAWGRLYRRYNPVTPARALQAMISVMVPPKVKDPKEIPAEIERWEAKVLSLQREYNEKLSERMKVAAITSMCPGDIQDLVFQQADRLDDYSKVREQIKAILLNRVSRTGPVPMDCGYTEQ